MWSSYRVPKSEQMAKKSSTYQIVIKTPMGRSWRAWMNPFSLKMLRHQAWERRLWHFESKNRSRAKSRFGRPTQGGVDAIGHPWLIHLSYNPLSFPHLGENSPEK